jgi:ubiquinone/menaquinone biosynthesis C-methylase UbiE
VPFRDRQFDYVICSLFTHHFRDPQVVNLLQEMARVARRKIFVIDLHRNAVAYTFYTTIAKLFLHNRLIREDGALSILRSFTPDEFRTLGDKARLKNVTVEEHFPSRLVLSAETA